MTKKHLGDQPYEERVGGSYVKDKGGKLHRREHTREAAPPAEPAEVSASEPAADQAVAGATPHEGN